MPSLLEPSIQNVASHLHFFQPGGMAPPAHADPRAFDGIGPARLYHSTLFTTRCLATRVSGFDARGNEQRVDEQHLPEEFLEGRGGGHARCSAALSVARQDRRVSYCESPDDAAIEILVMNCRGLTSRNLSGCRLLSDTACSHIARLSQLEELQLTCCNVPASLTWASSRSRAVAECCACWIWARSSSSQLSAR